MESDKKPSLALMLQARELIRGGSGPDWTEEEWCEWFNMQSPKMQAALLKAASEK